MFPIFKNFHSVTIPKAFVLNALVAAIVASFATSMRTSLNDEHDTWYIFFRQNNPRKGFGFQNNNMDRVYSNFFYFNDRVSYYVFVI